jgi:predicted secreted hydrolase
VTGHVSIDEKRVDVGGQAWMDREWSSQPLASDQSGWDWLSLHLNSGEKLMLYRMRQSDGRNYKSGSWISPDDSPMQIGSSDIGMNAKSFTQIGERKIPTTWEITIPRLGLKIQCDPLNAKSWMASSFPYWEGPISFAGSHSGVGYLEMTGY